MENEPQQTVGGGSGKKKLLIAVVLVVVIGGIASAASRWMGESAAERAIRAATGGAADVDVRNGDVTVKTADGTWTTSEKLPDGFPTDVPLYPGAKVKASVAGAGQQGGGHYVTLESSASIADIGAWYKKEVVAQGWAIETDATVSGSVMIGAKKDTRNLVVTITGDGDTVAIGLVVAQQ